MKVPPAPYLPDIAIPPGTTIVELLIEHRMGTDEFAARVGLTPAECGALLRGDLPIGDDLGSALSGLLGMPAHVWVNLDRNYRATLARLGEFRAGRSAGRFA